MTEESGKTDTKGVVSFEKTLTALITILGVFLSVLLSPFGLDMEVGPYVALAAFLGAGLWFVWRVWRADRVAAKVVITIGLVVLGVAWGILMYRASLPSFKIATLNHLPGDKNAYEVTDMLIGAGDDLRGYGVGITMTLEVLPRCSDQHSVGKVVAIVTDEDEQREKEYGLWESFADECGPYTLELPLDEILPLSGLKRDEDLSVSRLLSGQPQYQQTKIKVKIASASDKEHAWHTEEIVIRNAPWDFRGIQAWRDSHWEVDTYVKNLGAAGEFAVIYHLVRQDKEIDTGNSHPMHSGTTDIDYWIKPDSLHELRKNEAFTQTVALTHTLAPGRYLLDVYPIKKQEYANLTDDGWENLEADKELWLFAGPYQRFAFVITEPEFAMDPVIQAEWKRLRDKQGVDLGFPTGPAEAVTSVDEEGNPRTAGQRQIFQRGEIYLHDGKAYALYGPILRHYEKWGGLGSYMMGFPISPIQPVTSSLGTEGMMVQLEGHSNWPPSTIYSSTKSIAATWPWIGAIYSENLGGHTGWLGFPLTDEQDYEDSTLQMFERGYIVYYFPRVGEDRDWTRAPVAYPYLTSFGTIFEVQADQEWQDTGIQVESGAHIAIVQIADEWSWDGTSRTTDANGDHKWTISPNAPLPSAYMGSLVGRIGQGEDQVFPVGRWREYTSPAQGNLYLMVNDDQLDDNTGFVTVQIMIQAAE